MKISIFSAHLWKGKCGRNVGIFFSQRSGCFKGLRSTCRCFNCLTMYCRYSLIYFFFCWCHFNADVALLTLKKATANASVKRIVPNLTMLGSLEIFTEINSTWLGIQVQLSRISQCPCKLIGAARSWIIFWKFGYLFKENWELFSAQLLWKTSPFAYEISACMKLVFSHYCFYGQLRLLTVTVLAT